jgi:hypothetical protein
MNTKFAWVLVLGATLLVGCLPTLHPIYTERDLVFDPALVGVWKQNGAKWEFSRRDDTSYRLVHTDANGRQGRFTACLAKIDGVQILDLTPANSDSDPSPFQRFHELAIHTLYIVRRTEPDVELSALNLNWLNEYLAAHPNEIAYSVVDGKPILTAPTPELQRFVLAHHEAFKGAVKLVRER